MTTIPMPPVVLEHEPGVDSTCVQCSLVMLQLWYKPGSCAASLAEAKRLRAAAHESATGPTSLQGTLPGMRLAEGPRYRDVYHFHGLEALRVAWTCGVRIDRCRTRRPAVKG